MTTTAEKIRILRASRMGNLTCVEICAGAGGQALGLEQAGFEFEALVEIDEPCRNTLKHNRPAPPNAGRD